MSELITSEELHDLASHIVTGFLEDESICILQINETYLKHWFPNRYTTFCTNSINTKSQSWDILEGSFHRLDQSCTVVVDQQTMTIMLVDHDRHKNMRELAFPNIVEIDKSLSGKQPHEPIENVFEPIPGDFKNDVVDILEEIRAKKKELKE